jgi:uncharacterized protein (DUF736 family)
MATIIGTFTKTDNTFTGVVKTLALNVKTKIVPVDKDNDRAPDYRVYAGSTEFGGGWSKTARESSREYISLKLDDPSFPKPIYASLVEVDEDGTTYNLIWSRPNGD